MKKLSLFIILAVLSIFSFNGCKEKIYVNTLSNGSVIFIHPDGSGIGMWGALRLLKVGPDGMLNWDKMSHMGIYRSHLLNSASSSSNGGGTVHAYGVKSKYNSFGNNPEKPLRSLSGEKYSIMTEAKKRGKSIAIINSGHLCEPGTGVFLANAVSRSLEDTIAAQIIYSGADIIFAGGEVMLLPEGEIGFHGESGIRKDNRNLLNEAKKLGYTIILSRDELLKLPSNTEKVLGVFAARNTFNDLSEEELERLGLPLYNKNAPTLAEMTEVSLRILKEKHKDFYIVIEEEATDNFANNNNAKGALEALRRSDEAIGIAMTFVDNNSKTLLITAADSDAGAMQVIGIRNPKDFKKPLPLVSNNGSPLDGINGTGSQPFKAKSDRFGNNLRFAICWATGSDVMGAIVAKTYGFNSQYLLNNVDNTDIYRITYKTLFGVDL